MKRYPENDVEAIYRKTVWSIWDKLKKLWQAHGHEYIEEISGVPSIGIPEGQMEDYTMWEELGGAVQLDFLRFIEQEKNIDIDEFNVADYIDPSDRYEYDD